MQTLAPQELELKINVSGVVWGFDTKGIFSKMFEKKCYFIKLFSSFEVVGDIKGVSQKLN